MNTNCYGGLVVLVSFEKKTRHFYQINTLNTPA